MQPEGQHPALALDWQGQLRTNEACETGEPDQAACINALVCSSVSKPVCH